MKFYNPFKPHIVKDGFGRYFVRVRKLGWGWQFLDDSGYCFVSKCNVDGYPSFEGAQGTLESRKCRIEREREYQERKKNFKVVHASEN